MVRATTCIGRVPACIIRVMIYGGNGKLQWTPERNGIGHTHGSASSGANA
jgi:hypothetical protein